MGILAAFDDEPIEVNLQVITSCGNGTCEANLGENENNCSADCGCNYNGICESERGENNDNCPLDCPPPTPPASPPPGGGPAFFDTTPPVIFNLFISKITLNSASISWETNEQALCNLFWGRTSEYEEGAISETIFYLEHSTEITGLLSATAYHFKIVCRDTNRNESETTDQKFTTLAPPDITPPANVINFKVIPGDKQITLTWQNPPDLDFKGVKIMRSEDFYPMSPWEGVVIYNDKGTSVIDTGLTNGIRYYYTAFAYDKTGNYASGAIASAVPQAVAPPVVPPVTPPVVPPVVPPVTPPVVPPPEIVKLTLKDFDFIQRGKKLPLIEDRIVRAEAEIPLTISLDYKKIPETFKIIIVIFEKEEVSYSFLLRINKERTAFQSTVIFPEKGAYPFSINILNNKNKPIQKLDGEFQIEKIKIPPIPWYRKPGIWVIIIIIILIVSLLWLLLLLLVYLGKKIEEKLSEEKTKKSQNSTQNNHYPPKNSNC